jgi:membrane fusion protein, adhesin transport system
MSISLSSFGLNWGFSSAGRHVDPDHEAGRAVKVIVILIVAFQVVLLVWAGFSKLDVAVTARGAVVPPSKLQEVQSLEGGVVQDLLVSTGQAVKKGQLLARLDRAQYAASLGENQQYRLGALAGMARMRALLAGTEPKYPAEVLAAGPALLAQEQALHRDARREYESLVTAARESVVSRRSELQEAQSRTANLRQAVALSEKAFQIEERLFRESAGSQADYLASQQRLLTARSELAAAEASQPRLRAGLAEAQAQLGQAEAKARAQWGAQLAEFETKAGALASSIAGGQDRVFRRDLVAPVDGVVNRINVTTRGGVVQPGKALLEIVPSESDIMFTVRVKPNEVGFIRVGQEANVRVLAYDTASNGRLKATVARVGADAVVDERNEPYFEVQLSSPRGQLLQNGKNLPITAGLPVEVGILTGERSVLEYVLKPVMRGLQSSLQER